jgi:hypothetical protein
VTTHQILGLFEFAAIILQCFLGYYHHVQFLKLGHSTNSSRIHKVLGMVILCIGWVNMVMYVTPFYSTLPKSNPFLEFPKDVFREDADTALKYRGLSSSNTSLTLMIVLVASLALTIPALLYAELVTTYLCSILRQKTQSKRMRWQKLLDSEDSYPPISEADTVVDTSEIGIDDDDLEH